MELYENKNGMYWHIEPEEIVRRYIEENKKQKEVLNKIKEYINKYESIRAYYDYPDGEYWETDYDDDFKEEILELLEGANESI